MTEKRYFKRMWEEEYYIFDSYTISEKDFDEKVEYEDYQAFADSMTGEEVTDRLNKYNKAYLDCHNDVLRLEKENEQLKSDNKDYAKRYRELFNKYIELQKENKELKHENVNIMSDLDYFRTKNGSLEEGLFKKDRCIVKIEEETQQLKDLIRHMGYTIKNENGIITLELKR